MSKVGLLWTDVFTGPTAKVLSSIVYMTTRSGLRYETRMEGDNPGNTEGAVRTDMKSMDLTELVKFFMEECVQREWEVEQQQMLMQTTTPVTDMGSDALDKTRITAPQLKLTSLSE